MTQDYRKNYFKLIKNIDSRLKQKNIQIPIYIRTNKIKKPTI